ncbi:MAG: hypothetical protein ACHQ3P_00545 [Candidatus Limnocylindrales bacterium]
MTTPSDPGRDPILHRGVRAVVRRSRPVVKRARARFVDSMAPMRSIDGPELVPTPRIELDPDRTRPGRLVVLLNSLDLQRMTGGPNTAINLASRFAVRGHEVCFIDVRGKDPVDVNRLRRHATALAGQDLGNRVSFQTVGRPGTALRIGRQDVVLATWWATAHVAHRIVEMSGAPEFIYLIQDFEPAFYPWSTNHVLALKTYDFAFRAIFNEALVRDHVVSLGIGRFRSEEAVRRSIAFEPAVDRRLFRAGPRSGAKRLLFYARPKNPRNAFELGLRALRQAAAGGGIGPDWVVTSIGSQAPSLPLDRTRTMEAISWQSLTDYADLLGRSDVLLSLMLSPHTSYPPLEMAVAGGRTVTNTFGAKTASAMHAISPRIRAVEPDVDVLASAVAAALAQADADRDPSPDQASLPADWGAALAPTLDWLEETVADLRSAAR